MKNLSAHSLLQRFIVNELLNMNMDARHTQKSQVKQFVDDKNVLNKLLSLFMRQILSLKEEKNNVKKF